jgi:hypothetical protein
MHFPARYDFHSFLSITTAIKVINISKTSLYTESLTTANVGGYSKMTKLWLSGNLKFLKNVA